MDYEYTFYVKCSDTRFTFTSDVDIEFEKLNKKGCPLKIINKNGKSIWINLEEVYLIVKEAIGESTNDLLE